MIKYPRLCNITDLIKTAGDCQREVEPGLWAPTRPLGLCTLRFRFRVAWMVFTGRADAVVWPLQ